MTIIKRKLRRETAASVRDGGKLLPIILEIHPTHMVLRQKGHRRRYSLTYAGAYQYAVHLAVEEHRRLRRQKKARPSNS